MNNKLKEFINELENNLLDYEYKKYILNEEQIVYDVQNSAIYSILLKFKNNLEHIIVEEIFNDQVENVKLKNFCSKYTKAWVSYFPFYGELGMENPFKGESQYEKIKENIPKLEIDRRYDEWQGYRVVFAGFELVDTERKGFAIAKYINAGSINDLRRIGKELVNAYINSKEKEQSNDNYVYGKSVFEFIMDKNMCEILENRYIKDLKMPKLNNGFEIYDIQGFWTYGYMKNKDEIPYNVLEKLKGNRFQGIGGFNNLYTENMQKYMAKLEDLDKEYFYVEVEFIDIFDKNYSYLSNDETIKPGDKVLVNIAGEETIALVSKVGYYKGYEVPYPVEKTKYIIKKIEDPEEIKFYGFSIDDFEIYDEYNDNGYEIIKYYIVSTLSDNRKIVEDISKELLQRKLVDKTQISAVTSSFWWESKIQNKEEYKLEVKVRNNDLEIVSQVIKGMHNYIEPEIFTTEIK